MRRRSTILAAVLAAILILPAGVASAHEKGEHDRVAAVTEEATGLPADVAGTYTWAGDLFGLGVTTTITYTVELDEAGIPAITSISVDEGTLPEGAEATVWGPGSGVWERPGDDGEPVIKFASRAGVAVQLDDQRAGVLVKVRGITGDDPSATVKSVAIAAPVEEKEEEPEETPVVVIDDPSEDPDETDDEAADDEDRDRRGDKDRRDKDRHRDEGGEHRGWDVGWEKGDGDHWDHDDRGGDDGGERRSGKGDGREDCDPDELRDSDDHEDRGDRDGKDRHDDDEVSGGESDGGELDGDDSSDEEDQEL